MLWSIETCQNKVSADLYHVTISRAQIYSSLRSRDFWSWPLTKCWFSIGSWAQVWLTFWKQGRIVLKAVNANPELKVKTELLLFLLCKCFFAAMFCVYSDYWNSKQKAKHYTENLTSRSQNSNQNSTFCWVSSISFNRALKNPTQELRFIYYIFILNRGTFWPNFAKIRQIYYSI